MKLPKTGRKRALIVVDVQPAFIKPHNSHIIQNITRLIKNVAYDTYVVAVFSAEKGSIWDRQQSWFCPAGQDTHAVDEIKAQLDDKHPLEVLKHSRSVFRGDHDVRAYLKDHDIQEIHLVGTETNDCVLATAFDAFDSGFPVYVLEECCESATKGRHKKGLDILRLQSMTNNRCLAETEEILL